MRPESPSDVDQVLSEIDADLAKSVVPTPEEEIVSRIRDGLRTPVEEAPLLGTELERFDVAADVVVQDAGTLLLQRLDRMGADMERVAEILEALIREAPYFEFSEKIPAVRKLIEDSMRVRRAEVAAEVRKSPDALAKVSEQSAQAVFEEALDPSCEPRDPRYWMRNRAYEWAERTFPRVEKVPLPDFGYHDGQEVGDRHARRLHRRWQEAQIHRMAGNMSFTRGESMENDLNYVRPRGTLRAESRDGMCEMFDVVEDVLDAVKPDRQYPWHRDRFTERSYQLFGGALRQGAMADIRSVHTRAGLERAMEDVRLNRFRIYDSTQQDLLRTDMHEEGPILQRLYESGFAAGLIINSLSNTDCDSPSSLYGLRTVQGLLDPQMRARLDEVLGRMAESPELEGGQRVALAYLLNRPDLLEGSEYRDVAAVEARVREVSETLMAESLRSAVEYGYRFIETGRSGNLHEIITGRMAERDVRVAYADTMVQTYAILGILDQERKRSSRDAQSVVCTSDDFESALSHMNLRDLGSYADYAITQTIELRESNPSLARALSLLLAAHAMTIEYPETGEKMIRRLVREGLVSAEDVLSVHNSVLAAVEAGNRGSGRYLFQFYDHIRPLSERRTQGYDDQPAVFTQRLVVGQRFGGERDGKSEYSTRGQYGKHERGGASMYYLPSPSGSPSVERNDYALERKMSNQVEQIRRGVELARQYRERSELRSQEAWTPPEMAAWVRDPVPLPQDRLSQEYDWGAEAISGFKTAAKEFEKASPLAQRVATFRAVTDLAYTVDLFIAELETEEGRRKEMGKREALKLEAEKIRPGKVDDVRRARLMDRLRAMNEWNTVPVEVQQRVWAAVNGTKFFDQGSKNGLRALVLGEAATALDFVSMEYEHAVRVVDQTANPVTKMLERLTSGGDGHLMITGKDRQRRQVLLTHLTGDDLYSALQEVYSAAELNRRLADLVRNCEDREDGLLHVVNQYYQSMLAPIAERLGSRGTVPHQVAELTQQHQELMRQAEQDRFQLTNVGDSGAAKKALMDRAQRSYNLWRTSVLSRPATIDDSGAEWLHQVLEGRFPGVLGAAELQQPAE